MQEHEHDWRISKRLPPWSHAHAGERPVCYVRCAICKQVGFRYPGSDVILTWQCDAC